MRRSLPRRADRISAWCLLGFACGQFVVVPIVDAVTGGPGPFVLFGL